MDKKKLKQRFFMARELQLSISLIVVWSLLAGILFAYLTKELGTKIEHGIFSFIAVFLGYVIIVIVLSLFFTHRFIGPFERLKSELLRIMSLIEKEEIQCEKLREAILKSPFIPLFQRGGLFPLFGRRGSPKSRRLFGVKVEGWGEIL